MMNGRQIPYNSSHSFPAIVKKIGKDFEVNITKGSGYFCHSEVGVWSLEPKSSCIALSDKILFSTETQYLNLTINA